MSSTLTGYIWEPFLFPDTGGEAPGEEIEETSTELRREAGAEWLPPSRMANLLARSCAVKADVTLSIVVFRSIPAQSTSLNGDSSVTSLEGPAPTASVVILSIGNPGGYRMVGNGFRSWRGSVALSSFPSLLLSSAPRMENLTLPRVRGGRP